MQSVNRDGVLTTGEIARLLIVSPRTVAKWIDSGLLKGYKMPGSNHRRVTKVELGKFMVEHGIELGR